MKTRRCRANVPRLHTGATCLPVCNPFFKQVTIKTLLCARAIPYLQVVVIFLREVQHRDDVSWPAVEAYDRVVVRARRRLLRVKEAQREERLEVGRLRGTRTRSHTHTRKAYASAVHGRSGCVHRSARQWMTIRQPRLTWHKSKVNTPGLKCRAPRSQRKIIKHGSVTNNVETQCDMQLCRQLNA